MRLDYSPKTLNGKGHHTMSRFYYAFQFFLVLLFTLLAAGCSTTRQVEGLRQEALPSAAQAKEMDEPFGTTLTRHLDLPEEEQQDLHDKALAHLEELEQFKMEARQSKDASLRHWYYRGVQLDRSTYGVGLGNSITNLKIATTADPSFAEAWCDLGHLCAVAGDLNKASQYLDRARLAALARNQKGRPVAAEDQLRIFQQRAWVLRDLGHWQEGLDAVDEGLRFRKGDRDLVLIKGLLLAGAGRYSEANSLAVRMKPFSYPQLDVFHYGARDQTSDYANRWIKSQALLAIGDYELARHVIGELTSYPYRWFLPHQKRFWTDVGLVAELAGDEDAGVYYAIGLISDHYYGFYPFGAGNFEPLVLDVPGEEIPFFTTFGGRFYLGGSPLAYAASQMNMMSMGIFQGQRSQAAWRAREALDIAERRHIRPAVARAMRGRVNFAQEDFAAAKDDLSRACAEFRTAGTIDPGSSLLLGLLNVQEGKHAQAIPLFEEAVATDEGLTTAWRSLSVSLVHLGRREEAALAMDRALEQDPRSLVGLYNRGLLHLQAKEFAAATSCLDRALKQDPENHEVLRLLQMAATGHRSAGGDPAEIQMLTEAAENAATLNGDMNAEELLATLDADIQEFFAVPDSLRETMGSADQVVASLQAQWISTGDLMARKILALAFMDRGMYEDVQELLGPGWGVDLAPEEEIMLLYADRIQGEDERSKDLAKMLLSSRRGPGNPYLVTMLPLEDRLHWTQTMLMGNHYPEGYSAKHQGLGDLARYSRNMRYGFQNIRMANTAGMGVGTVWLEKPFTRFSRDRGGVDSAGSGARPVSGRQSGNVIK